MSEFNKTHLKEWLEIMFKHNTNILEALRYYYYFYNEDKRNDKINRAYRYAKKELIGE